MKNYKYPRFLYRLFQLHFGTSEGFPAACPLIVKVLLSRSNKEWITFFWCYEVNSWFYTTSWHFYWGRIQSMTENCNNNLQNVTKRPECLKILKIDLTDIVHAACKCLCFDNRNSTNAWILMLVPAFNGQAKIVPSGSFPPSYVMVSKSCRLSVNYRYYGVHELWINTVLAIRVHWLMTIWQQWRIMYQNLPLQQI